MSEIITSGEPADLSGMVPDQPTDHDLNACLARVMGKEVQPFKDSNKQGWAYKFGPDKWDWATWDPLHEANQMEEVEAGLREKFGEVLRVESVWHWSLVHHKWNYQTEIMIGDDIFMFMHHDKKRALAMAIWEMEKHATKT